MRSAIFLVCLTACSSSSFDIASTDSAAQEADSSAEETSITEDTAIEDGGTSEGSPGCPSSADPLEIWVDAASSAATPTGDKACPFAHVADAADFLARLPAKPRTIRVAMGTYEEARAVRLAKGIRLIGSGAATVIKGSSVCNDGGLFPCIVRLDQGASIESVTVTGLKAADAIAILALGGSNVGPAVYALGNTTGLQTEGVGDITVTGPNNRFDNNTTYGVFHTANGRLLFTGGSCSGNNNGMRIGLSISGTVPISEVKNLIANDNFIGLRIVADGSAKVRNSTFRNNRFGVIAVSGVANSIDLGTGSSAGGNVFGANMLAGVCAPNEIRSKLPLVGNTWPSCTTTPVAFAAGDCDKLGSYADVWYTGAYTPDKTGCMVGM
jgi:hypothetical protein